MPENDFTNRRASARRLPPLSCGHADPWLCRCGDDTGQPSERAVDAYKAALRHLEAVGLMGAAFMPELRAMWRRGGDDRAMAREILDSQDVAQ